MHLFVKGVDFSSFYDLYLCCLSCSDSSIWFNVIKYIVVQKIESEILQYGHVIGKHIFDDNNISYIFCISLF